MAETAVAIPPEGTKRMSEEDLWSLVMATMRLRLTAYSLAGLKVAVSIGDPGDPGAVRLDPGWAPAACRRPDDVLRTDRDAGRAVRPH